MKKAEMDLCPSPLSCALFCKHFVNKQLFSILLHENVQQRGGLALWVESVSEGSLLTALLRGSQERLRCSLFALADAANFSEAGSLTDFFGYDATALKSFVGADAHIRPWGSGILCKAQKKKNAEI